MPTTDEIQKRNYLIEKTKNCNCKNTHPFIPDITEGLVIKCYDGDTITIATIIPGSDDPCRFSVRLSGLDTPELRTHDKDEKECGYVVRNFVHSLVFNKIVRLSDISFDYYGRILARVFFQAETTDETKDKITEETTDETKDEITDESCLNDILLEKRYAVPYNGKTKPIVDWKRYMNPRGNDMPNVGSNDILYVRKNSTERFD
jgi:micrococcal nuclease